MARTKRALVLEALCLNYTALLGVRYEGGGSKKNPAERMMAVARCGILRLMRNFSVNR